MKTKQQSTEHQQSISNGPSHFHLMIKKKKVTPHAFINLNSKKDSEPLSLPHSQPPFPSPPPPKKKKYTDTSRLVHISSSCLIVCSQISQQKHGEHNMCLYQLQYKGGNNPCNVKISQSYSTQDTPRPRKRYNGTSNAQDLKLLCGHSYIQFTSTFKFLSSHLYEHLNIYPFIDSFTKMYYNIQNFQ